MTKTQQPITCQEIFEDAKRLFPHKYAKVIAQDSIGISLRRVYAVFSGNITDPVKIREVAVEAAAKIRQFIDPTYALDREIVLGNSSITKPKS